MYGFCFEKVYILNNGGQLLKVTHNQNIPSPVGF